MSADGKDSKKNEKDTLHETSDSQVDANSQETAPRQTWRSRLQRMFGFGLCLCSKIKRPSPNVHQPVDTKKTENHEKMKSPSDGKSHHNQTIDKSNQSNRNKKGNQTNQLNQSDQVCDKTQMYQLKEGSRAKETSKSKQACNNKRNESQETTETHQKKQKSRPNPEKQSKHQKVPSNQENKGSQTCESDQKGKVKCQPNAYQHNQIFARKSICRTTSVRDPNPMGQANQEYQPDLECRPNPMRRASTVEAGAYPTMCPIQTESMFLQQQHDHKHIPFEVKFKKEGRLAMKSAKMMTCLANELLNRKYGDRMLKSVDLARLSSAIDVVIDEYWEKYKDTNATYTKILNNKDTREGMHSFDEELGRFFRALLHNFDDFGADLARVYLECSDLDDLTAEGSESQEMKNLETRKERDESQEMKKLETRKERNESQEMKKLERRKERDELEYEKSHPESNNLKQSKKQSTKKKTTERKMHHIERQDMLGKTEEYPQENPVTTEYKKEEQSHDILTEILNQTSGADDAKFIDFLLKQDEENRVHSSLHELDLSEEELKTSCESEHNADVINDVYYELGEYRLDDGTIETKSKKGSMLQYQRQSLKKKIKSRGVPNKHLICKQPIPEDAHEITEDDKDEKNDNDEDENMLGATSQNSGSTTETPDTMQNPCSNSNHSAVMKTEIELDIRHEINDACTVIRGKKDDCELLEERYGGVEPKPYKHRRKPRKEKGTPLLLIHNMNNSADTDSEEEGQDVGVLTSDKPLTMDGISEGLTNAF